jgi:hypothetical protein
MGSLWIFFCAVLCSSCPHTCLEKDHVPLSLPLIITLHHRPHQVEEGVAPGPHHTPGKQLHLQQQPKKKNSSMLTQQQGLQGVDLQKDVILGPHQEVQGIMHTPIVAVNV